MINKSLLRKCPLFIYQIKLINFMARFWSIGAICALILTQVRALSIGWSIQDVINFFFICPFIILTLFLGKLPLQLKAIFLIIANMAIGFIGFYKMGMLAGSVFLFPMGTIITALVFSKRATIFMAIISLLLLCFIQGNRM